MGAADLTLKMLLLGEDRSMSRTAKQAGDEVEKTGSKAEKFGKAAAVGIGAIGGGIALMLKTGWDETKDAEAGTAQLAAGIQSTHNAAQVTVGGLNDLASSIQGYSGQTDDSIVKSEQLLLTFTNIKNNTPDKIFDQATKATADMAAKMGGDASQSAVLLGKALNDPIKGVSALQKVGVSFSDAQKTQIAAMMKTGDVAGAQGVILKELQTEFGGAAKAAGESVPGQMARAKRSFEDTSQAVVTDLLPIFTQLMGLITNVGLPAIKHLSEFWMQHKTILSIVGGAILLIVIAVKTITLVTKIWTATQAALNVVMSLNPIALVVIAILALIAIIVVIATKTTWFQTIWRVAFGAVHAAISAVFNWVRTNWPLLLAILTGPIGLAVLMIMRHWTTIKNGVLDVKNWIVNRFADVLNFFAGLPGRIGRLAAHLFDGFKDGFRNAINWIIGAWNSLHFSVNIPKVHIKGTNFDVGGGSFGFGVPSIPLLALGGDITRGGSVIVGDNGPEILNLPAGARVSPLGRGGGSAPIIIQLGVLYGDARQAARVIASELEKLSNSGTPLNIRIAN